MRQKVLIFFSLILISVTLYKMKIWGTQLPSSISVFYSYAAESADPIDYDMGVHHLTMRSVYSSLVSEYTLGKISPDLALDWSSSPDFKNWNFKIDLSRKFESGETVNPEIIAFSLNRLAYLMHKKGSDSGVLEHLVGFSDITAPNQLIKGISFDENNLYLNFVIPMPRLVNKIAFGLYGIVHPSDYDQNNGIWKDSRKINSSGHYRIKTWDHKSMEIEIKPQFQNMGRFNNIKFKFLVFSESDEFDIVVTSSEARLEKLGYKFTSRVKSKIRYIECMKWKDSNSFCGKHENRVMLRDYIYEHLESVGLKPVRSFFPLSIPGVKEFFSLKVDNGNKFFDEKYEVSYIVKTFTKSNGVPQKEINFADAFYEAVESFANNKGVKLNKYLDSDVADSGVSIVDFKLDITGILLDFPKDDILFMFKSKEGIQLPDSDGSIMSKINERSFDIQDINSLLWDQAIVWPINHLSYGSWIKENSKVDLRNVNLDLLPMDFWWVFSN